MLIKDKPFQMFAWEFELCHYGSGSGFCWQPGGTQTGDGFADVLDIVRVHFPMIIVLENVPKLMQIKKGHKVSDADRITGPEKKLGCTAMHKLLHHQEMGGFGRRSRVYWIGLKHLQGEEPEIRHFLHTVVTGMAPVEPEDPDMIFNPDSEVRQELVRSLGMTAIADIGLLRTSSKAAKLNWKVFHRELTTRLGHPVSGSRIKYPIDVQNASAWVDLSGLLPREQEAVIILDTYFSPQVLGHVCSCL